MSGNPDCHAQVNFVQARLIGAYFALDFAVVVGDCNFSTGSFAYSVSYIGNSSTPTQRGPQNFGWSNTQGASNVTVTDTGLQIPNDSTNVTAVVDASTILCTCIAGGSASRKLRRLSRGQAA